MLEGIPSRTAWRVARRRAAHQILDQPAIFTDPIALRIVGETAASFLNDERERTTTARGLRAFMAVRSRIAEDALAAAVSGGVAQYVVLGAGLDTFAYRNPFGDRLRVFEVDAAATQQWKREQLEARAIAVPAALTFVPVDFTRETTFDALAAAGFDATEPAFVSWLGVTMYLDEPIVRGMLTSIAALAPGSGVVFDYSLSPSMLGLLQRRVLEEFSRRVAAAGEPWITSFEPPALRVVLGEAGFSRIEDLSPDDINGRYFRGRADGLRVGSLANVMCAFK